MGLCELKITESTIESSVSNRIDVSKRGLSSLINCAKFDFIQEASSQKDGKISAAGGAVKLGCPIDSFCNFAMPTNLQCGSTVPSIRLQPV